MLRNFARIAFSVARIRFFTVSRSILNPPFRVVLQQCVNPRKSNVSGFPSPRRFRFLIAKRPNSISRVLSCVAGICDLQRYGHF